MRPHLLVFVDSPDGKGHEGLIVSSALLRNSRLLPQPAAREIAAELTIKTNNNGGRSLVSLGEFAERLPNIDHKSFATKVADLKRAGKIDALQLHNVNTLMVAALNDPKSDVSTDKTFPDFRKRGPVNIRNAFREIAESALVRSTAGKGLDSHEQNAFRRGPSKDVLTLRRDIRENSETVGRIETEITFRTDDYSSLHMVVRDDKGSVVIDITDDDLPTALHSEIRPAEDGPIHFGYAIRNLILKSKQPWIVSHIEALETVTDNLAIDAQQAALRGSAFEL